MLRALQKSSVPSISRNLPLSICSALRDNDVRRQAGDVVWKKKERIKKAGPDKYLHWDLAEKRKES